MTNDKAKVPARQSSPPEIDTFVEHLRSLPAGGSNAGRGRLIFALDATASRQPTWDRASQLQGEMFQEAASLGGLALQLCFYRGFGEFRASPWLTRSEHLLTLMSSVSCRAGRTQIAKVLQHAVNESERQPLAALVFVGDCMEEDVDALGVAAGRLGLMGVRAFLFHEGTEPMAAFAFKQIARLTGGAYARFDHGSAHLLRDLLRAVAAFVAGGMPALEKLAASDSGEIRRIAYQVRHPVRG